MISMAVTTRALVGAFGPFLAAIADNRGRKLGMLTGLSLFIAGTMLVVFWPTIPTFFAALILTMLGKYVFDPTTQAYLGDRVPYERRGTAIAITEYGWSLSFIIGIPAVGFLISRFGWVAPFPLLLGLGVLSFIGLIWLIPKDPPPVEDRPKFLQNIRAVLTFGPALAGLSFGLLVSAGNEVVNLVFGVWVEDAFSLQIAALGTVAMVIGLSELGGESLSVAFTDRMGKARAVGLGLILNSLAALSLAYLGRSLIGAVVGLFLFYITFEFSMVSSIPMMTEIMPGARATLLATNVAGFSLGRALGAALAPSLYSYGILASGIAAVSFNLLALIALRQLQQGLAERGP
jgi:predicted MFS family arabinose efflux permease